MLRKYNETSYFSEIRHNFTNFKPIFTFVLQQVLICVILGSSSLILSTTYFPHQLPVCLFLLSNCQHSRPAFLSSTSNVWSQFLCLLFFTPSSLDQTSVPLAANSNGSLPLCKGYRATKREQEICLIPIHTLVLISGRAQQIKQTILAGLAWSRMDEFLNRRQNK